MPNVIKTIGRLGVNVDWPAFPAMLLGAGGMSPMQVATMYQTIANGGFNTPMRGIRSVLTAEGEPLKRYPFQIQQTFDGCHLPGTERHATRNARRYRAFGVQHLATLADPGGQDRYQ